MASGRSLDLMFNPSSMAIVGDRKENNFYFSRVIYKAGFKGIVYYVNTGVEHALGQKFFKSVLEIPDPVDYAIVSVPARAVPSVVSDCAMKGVRFVSIFSSGFSETGSAEGKKLEDAILAAAEGKVRVIGPNCMGVYCPKTGMAFRPDQSGRTGPVAFISQSGGLSINFTVSGKRHGIRFSKVVSYGNGIDISDAELLDYLANDPETSIITAYLEGTKDGPGLLNALKRASDRKTVVIWKGGRTYSGAAAVASHTGSLAGSPQIWEAMMKQTKVVQVTSFDELVGTTKLLLYSPPPKGRNVSLVSISGGSSVVNADIAIQNGLQVPELTEDTKKKLRPIVQAVGTSVSNPIDLAGSFYNSEVLQQVITTIGEDPMIHAVIIEIAPLYPVPYSKLIKNRKLPTQVWATLIDTAKCLKSSAGKPIMVTVVDIGYEKESRSIEKKLTENSIPCFQSIGEASKALARLAEHRGL